MDTLFFPELQMYDLLAFATARLAEEEAAAEAATPGTWQATGADIIARSDDPHWDRACAANAAGADAAHIAHYDPPRALRDINAKRLVLAEHLPVESMYGLVCKRCVSWQTPPWADGGETEFGIAISDPWPCLPVRGAVASWERHPDFKPEWAVTA